MFDFVPKFIDQYEMRARLLPGLAMLSPLIFSLWAWLPVSIAWNSIITIIVTCGGISILLGTVRDKGMSLERRLFKDGLPTTCMLRQRDKTLDPITKQRYQKCLEKKIHNIKFPSLEAELLDPESADSHYISAANWLKEETRDRTKYPLVFEELCNYGFSRNLLGIKPYGLVLSIFIFAISVVRIFIIYGKVINNVPPIACIALIYSTFILFSWLVFVNQTIVFSSASAYSRALLASCEKL